MDDLLIFFHGLKNSFKGITKYERSYISFPLAGLSYGRIPKNANTAIKLALRRDFNLPKDSLSPAKDFYWKSLQLKEVRFEKPAHAYRSHYPITFSVIRQPDTRILSCYQNKIAAPHRGIILKSLRSLGFYKKMPLADFIDLACALPNWKTDMHLRDQTYYLFHRKKLIPNVILIFERLDKDWPKFCSMVREALKINLGDLPFANKTGKLPDMPSHLKTKVQQRYERDYNFYYKVLDNTLL